MKLLLHDLAQPSRAVRYPIARGAGLAAVVWACASASCGKSTSAGAASQTDASASGADGPTGTPPDATAGTSPDGSPVDATADVMPSTATPTIVVSGDAPITAPITSFGQNYWNWVDSYGDPVAQVQSGAAAMKLNLLRAGGHNNDDNNPQAFSNAEIDTFVAYARAIGAEPVLQVPLLADATDAAPTAQTAADMVTYANVTMKYGIKYWEIGNEPDLYSDQGDKPAGYTAQSYCADFTAFAAAMRAVDPTIQILGPELSYKYVAGNDWLTPFLAGCGAQVDIVSVHRYPFNAATSTIADAMGDGASLRAIVGNLRAIMSATGVASKPLAITETNFSYQGDPSLQTASAALGTFYAGLWAGEQAAIGLELGLWTDAFWSLDESYFTGFFTSDTFAPRPAAYAYALVSTHFGPSILHATTVPAGMSAHASRDAAGTKTIVLLVNRTAADTTQILGFTGLAAALSGWSVSVPAYAMVLLELPDDGSAPAVWLYTAAMAAANEGPQQQ